MKDVILKAEKSNSVIHCGAGAFDVYAPKFADRQVYVVTDGNVYALYRELIWKVFGKFVPITILPAGESCKTQRYLFEILGGMAEHGMTRQCTVVAFGGGVVGDIAGLAASLYMRGVKIVQIPTTLLAQVDSSVGGKTAIDFKKIKNLIGTFYQPEEVICDPRFLQTLPAREIRCGLGEIVKYGALDAEIFTKLCANAENLPDEKFLEDIIYDCVAHKAKVVARDEHDTGVRKTLNLGHTTGHAFELYYGRKSHGEFVLIGMYYEMYIAAKLGVCKGEYYDNLVSLIKCVIKKIPAYEDIEQAALNAKHDKKNSTTSKISMITPQVKGRSAEIILSAEEYVQLICECRDKLKEEYENS